MLGLILLAAARSPRDAHAFKAYVGNAVGGHGEGGIQCTNAVDDDGNGFVNDGCPAVGPPETGDQCNNAIDDDGDGVVNDGCPTNPSVSVIDTSTNAVVKTLALSHTFPDSYSFSPRGIAAAPDGGHVFVVGDEADGPVDVIDTTTNTVVNTSFLGAQLMGVAVTPDACSLYVIGSEFIEHLDATTYADLGAVDLSALPYAALAFQDIVVSPVGHRAYVADSYNGVVHVIDTQTDSVVTSIPTGAETTPLSLAVNADGSRVYVSLGDSSIEVAVIDPSLIGTGMDPVIATATNGAVGNSGVVVVPNGFTYVGLVDTLWLIDDATNMTSATQIQVTGNPPHDLFKLGVTPDGTKLYAVDYSFVDSATNRHAVWAVDTTSNTVVKEIPIDGTPIVITVAPTHTTFPACGAASTTTTTSTTAPGATTTSSTHAAATTTSTTVATPTTTAPAHTTTTSTTAPTPTTTLPPVETCATATVCLEALQPSDVCTETINPKLLTAVRSKLNAALSALLKAKGTSNPKKMARFAKKAQTALHVIDTKAAKFATVKKDPISPTCRDDITQAIQPAIDRIAQGEL